MLSRAVPLFKVLLVVLVIGLLVLAGAFVRLAVVGTGSKAPRTELERAIVAAEEAVKADPNNANARLKLAAAYIERKNFSAALDQADAANRLTPNDPTVYYVRGLAAAGKGDDAAAVADFQKAAGLEGQLAQFYQDVYVAMARAQDKLGKFKDGVASMDKAIDFNPENAALIFERGQMHERDKNWLLALYDYGQALQFIPGYEPAQQAFSRLSAAHPDILKKLQEAFKNNEDIIPGVQPFDPNSAAATSTAPAATTGTT